MRIMRSCAGLFRAAMDSGMTNVGRSVPMTAGPMAARQTRSVGRRGIRSDRHACTKASVSPGGGRTEGARCASSAFAGE